MSTQFGWDEGTIKPFQLAGVKAQLEGIDTVIQAPTGAGKTVIAAGPHSSPRASGMITLISVPLVQLAEDMVCERLFAEVETQCVNCATGCYILR